jgi:hypothetical protein
MEIMASHHGRGCSKRKERGESRKAGGMQLMGSLPIDRPEALEVDLKQTMVKNLAESR